MEQNGNVLHVVALLLFFFLLGDWIEGLLGEVPFGPMKEANH